MKQLTDETARQVGRLRELRDSIGIEAIKLEIDPGDLLVIRPKDESVRFSTQYCQWIMDVLNEYVKNKNNVKVILLAERDTELLTAKPSESGGEYMRGWDDAIKSLGRTES